MCCTICANIEFPWRLGWSSWRVGVYFNELQGPCKFAEDHVTCLSGATSHRVASLRWWVRDSNCQHECTLRSSREHWDVCVFAQNGVQTVDLIDLIWRNERECNEIDTKEQASMVSSHGSQEHHVVQCNGDTPRGFHRFQKCEAFPHPQLLKDLEERDCHLSVKSCCNHNELYVNQNFVGLNKILYKYIYISYPNSWRFFHHPWWENDIPKTTSLWGQLHMFRCLGGKRGP